jgi:hypothetical protein
MAAKITGPPSGPSHTIADGSRFSGVNPLEYLTAVQKHARLVSENPEQWLPWNFLAEPTAADTG